jgi:hypothetical protein
MATVTLYNNSGDQFSRLHAAYLDVLHHLDVLHYTWMYCITTVMQYIQRCKSEGLARETTPTPKPQARSRHIWVGRAGKYMQSIIMGVASQNGCG